MKLQRKRGRGIKEAEKKKKKNTGEESSREEGGKDRFATYQNQLHREGVGETGVQKKKKRRRKRRLHWARLGRTVEGRR